MAKYLDCTVYPEGSLNVISLPLFAYYMALSRGCAVDKQRNLAKSVAVE